MKLFAFALLVAAVSAEETARNARSLGVLGHGLPGIAVPGVAHIPTLATAGLVSPAHLAVGVSPIGLHGIHRRSLLPSAVLGVHATPVLAGPVGLSIGHSSLLGGSLGGLGLHGAPLLRHGRSVLGVPALVGAHGWASAAVAPVHAAIPVIGAHSAILPGIGHGAHVIG